MFKKYLKTSIRAMFFISGILWFSSVLAFDDSNTKGNYCARLLVQPAPKVIRVATLNTKQLYIKLKTDRHSREFIDTGNDRIFPKTVQQVEKLADLIGSTDADVVVLQEVKSLDELIFLNRNYFGNRYDVYRLPGNDFIPRNEGIGFEIAFLVRKGMNFNVEIESNRHMRWKGERSRETTPLFTRDLPILTFKNKESGQPAFIVMGHHAKSLRNNETRPNVAQKRLAQHEVIADKVREYQKKYGAGLPIILAGDFNGDIHNSESTQPVLEEMNDSLDMVEKPLTAEDRATFTTFERDKTAQYEQIDGILVSKQADVKVQRAGIRRDVDHLAESFKQRNRQTSDHFMVFADIEFLF